MLKIAICDDSPQQIGRIQAAAETYFSTHAGWDIQIETHGNSLLFLEQLEGSGGCDIALLDICMPGILGTQVAKEIRRRHDKTEIIFLTTSDEYAVDAFVLKATHYLLKPFTQVQFDEAMDRAMKAFADTARGHITVRTNSGELHNLDINDIFYIESQGHSFTIFLKEQTLSESRRSILRLQEELEALSPGQFITPYKGYIVNQKYIASIQKDCMVLRNGAKIPIPKREYKALQDRYMDYIFEAKSAGGEAK